MTFEYTRQINSYYSVELDEYFYDEEQITYEPEDDEIIYALADILVGNTGYGKLDDGDYMLCIQIVKDIIESQGWMDTLAKKYEKDLKDWFEDEAMEIYK